ncbi:MAG: S1C family serine protease [Acidimicrobiales bacterium]
MVDPGNDFDDFQDDDLRQPLLPPEDRLWRHPSEAGATTGVLSPDQALAARRRWLAATPTRAGAGAGALVGALLAAGVVLVGTHLTAWLTPPQTTQPKTTLRAASIDAPVTTTAATVPVVSARELGALFANVGSALVTVRVVRPSGTKEADGVLISRDGYVLVPSSEIAGAISVSVITSNSEELIATVTGREGEIGLSVLHVLGSDLPFIRLSPSKSQPGGSFTLLAWRDSQLELSLAQVSTSPSLTSVGDGPPLIEVPPPSLGLAHVPNGTLLIDGSGQISGIVTSHRGQRALVVPGWLAAHVARELIAHGHVTHAWLGIEGRATSLSEYVMLEHTSTSMVSQQEHAADLVRGIRVVAVQPKSAAARAGLRRGDVIEAVNGKPVPNMGALKAILYLMIPTAPVKLEIVRGHQLSEVNAQLQPAA